MVPTLGSQWSGAVNPKVASAVASGKFVSVSRYFDLIDHIKETERARGVYDRVVSKRAQIQVESKKMGKGESGNFDIDLPGELVDPQRSVANN